MKRIAALLSAALALSCGGDQHGPAPAPEPTVSNPPGTPPATPTVTATATSTVAPTQPTSAPLDVKFLGVAGFLLTYGGEAVLTAPLYTRPNTFEVLTMPVTSDTAAVEAALPTPTLAPVRAVVSGHAHYDHLIDVPSILARAPQTTLFSNMTAKHLLAALAPDRAARCDAGAPASPSIARSRVVAMDDPAASVVDYRSCPSKKPDGAPLQGTWVRVPGAHVRMLAFCSEHPDQIGPVHFAAGSVDEDQCELPQRAPDWKEGNTLSFLIDFLDPATDAPVYRVYYQDAPTSPPVGLPPQEVLAEKRVDLALLCVGTYDRVDNAPTSALQALSPRYALGGHWEDFFRPASDAPQPIPFLDVNTWSSRAHTGLPPGPELPLTRNGSPEPERALMPQPADAFRLNR